MSARRRSILAGYRSVNSSILRGVHVKLHYYRDPRGNFGDDLNVWLWEKLYPEVLNGSDDQLFVGIGTILTSSLPVDVVKHVFGSGVGYGSIPNPDDNFVFHAVRGPRTASRLGLDPALAVTDPAVLIRAVKTPDDIARSGIGFIPHHFSSFCFDWSTVCQELGFKHICAQWDVDRVLREMLSCEVLLCEAMHGAIVADALRIPWIPVKAYDFINDFKWRDWLDTLEFEYRPASVTPLFNVERNYTALKRVKVAVQRRLIGAGLWDPGKRFISPGTTGDVELREAIVDLNDASKLRPILSDESRLVNYTDRYLELLHNLRRSQGLEQAS